MERNDEEDQARKDNGLFKRIEAVYTANPTSLRTGSRRESSREWRACLDSSTASNTVLSALMAENSSKRYSIEWGRYGRVHGGWRCCKKLKDLCRGGRPSYSTASGGISMLLPFVKVRARPLYAISTPRTAHHTSTSRHSKQYRRNGSAATLPRPLPARTSGVPPCPTPHRPLPPRQPHHRDKHMPIADPHRFKL